MRQYIILPFFILLSVSLFGQAQLTVSGESSMTVSPTEAEIVISLNTKRNTYANAVEDLVERSNKISKVLNKLDFADSEIKSSNFNVSKLSRYDNGKQVEDGFRATQQLSVSFAMDSRKLINILEKTTASDAKPEVSVNFGLDDKSESQLKEELLKKAVDDARKKAGIIATQSGYKISGIQTIHYGISPQNPLPQPRGMMMEMAAMSDAKLQNFEASDLAFSDNVVITYLIEKL